MATVNGLTAEAMDDIRDAVIVDANVVGDNLILTRYDGTTIDVGSVRGIQGIQGIPGTIASAPAGGDLAGNYPDPTIGLLKVVTGYLADGAVTRSKLASGLAVPTGGATGQFLKKNSGADGDFVWGGAPYTRSIQSINFDANGDGTVTHGLGATPSSVGAIVASHEGQLNVVSVVSNSINNTTFKLRLRNATAAIPNVSRTISWQAFA